MATLKKSAYEIGAEHLFDGARSRRYSKNQLIHYQGDPLTHIYLVRRGHVKAYTILDSGDTRTILLLSPGDIFPIAFSTTLDWEKYQIKYFYQTLTDVELQLLDRETFRDLIDNDNQMMKNYLSYLTASNQAISNQLEVMKNKKAINKVELLLPYLVLKLGEEIKPHKFRLKIKLSHQEVADLSGVTRETTTTLVKQLEKKGVLEQSHGFWIINTSKTDAGPFEQF